MAAFQSLCIVAAPLIEGFCSLEACSFLLCILWPIIYAYFSIVITYERSPYWPLAFIWCFTLLFQHFALYSCFSHLGILQWYQSIILAQPVHLEKEICHLKKENLLLIERRGIKEEDTEILIIQMKNKTRVKILYLEVKIKRRSSLRSFLEPCKTLLKRSRRWQCIDSRNPLKDFIMGKALECPTTGMIN